MDFLEETHVRSVSTLIDIFRFESLVLGVHHRRSTHSRSSDNDHALTKSNILPQNYHVSNKQIAGKSFGGILPRTMMHATNV